MLNFLRHIFTPHESNNHRSKILHVDSILIVISLLIFSSILLSSLQSKFPSVLGISYNITPAELLNETNRIRQQNGKSQLVLDPKLSQAAANKAQDMLAKNYWAHIAPDGITPWVFIKNSGYEYLYAGENLARGFPNSLDVVNAWMASPSHRDNMLSSNYADIGFGIATGSLTGTDTVLVVEMFGTKYAGEEAAPVIIPSPTPLSEPIAALEIITITPTPTPKIIERSQEGVASIQQRPLVDKNNFTKNIIVIILIAFIAILTIDAVIIERKKIIRAVSHNLDHIIYLIIILLGIIIIGKGAIL